jgi:hypothetical protein
VWAQNLLSAANGSDAERLQRAVRRCSARIIRPNEAESLARFLANQRAHYQERPDAARRLVQTGSWPSAAELDVVEWAAWTQVCRVLLNLQETITVY